MAWYDIATKAISGISQLGGVVLDLQTKRANLNAMKANAAAQQAASQTPALPATSPYSDGKPPAPSMFSNPMILAAIALVVVIGGFFAFRAKS